ncbi:hypothetical protein GLOIN_2v1770262 [Rhizophagus irregularis DAOM 181602=DAOM 197198]|nr:hypothetical protein GLOIN_2v1770262 [Rhizophagus irregularis DAOM 181602=DAOM 197198]
MYLPPINIILPSLSEFLDISAPYKQDFKASDIGEYFYKICDDSIRPRQFLDTDNADDGIEAILLEREGHFLYKIIDGNESLYPIINFDLPIETLDAIIPKLLYKQAKNLLCCTFRDTCLKISPKWDKETIFIAKSSDEKKISLHVLTFGMRLPNIAKVSVFTKLIRKKLPVKLQKKSIINNIANISSFKSFSLRMFGSPKYNEKTEEHIRVKKAICPKDRTIFDFMICSPNDDSKKYYPEIILSKAILSHFLQIIYLLTHNSPSDCPLCKQKHTSDNGYILRNKKSYRFYCHRANHERNSGMRNPSTNPEFQISTIASREVTLRLWVLKTENTNGGLYFDMASKLDFAKYEVNLVELGGFLAKPVIEINKEIIDLILWYISNVICDKNKEFNEYIWNCAIQARKLIVIINKTGMSSGNGIDLMDISNHL